MPEDKRVRKIPRDVLADILLFIAAAAITVGVGWIWIPLAFIVGGVLLAAIAIWIGVNT
jgi:hypothetical protein